MFIVAGSNKGWRPYLPEFKREAVELYRRSGKSIGQVASEIGVAPESLRKWNLQHEVDVGEREGLRSDERTRLAELERENQRLRMERDLLKRAAAFFARRPRPGERVPVHLGGEGPHPGLRLLRAARRQPVGLLRLAAPAAERPRVA
jgi:transposase